MDDDFDELVVSVRADTAAFTQDMARMKTAFDGTLIEGFAGAGKVLERSLLTALRTGKLGFEDLKAAALAVLDQIADRALRSGLDALLGGLGGGFGGGFGGGGAPAGLGGLLTGLAGLPGRATGGLVGPDRPYLVGERGPEVFVPATAGHVVPGPAPRGGGGGRQVRVAITLNQPRGQDAPAALQRSSRQVASAIRRALTA